MFEYINCNLCGSNKTELVYKSNLKAADLRNIEHFSCTNSNFTRHGAIVRCKDCGLIYSNPRFILSEVENRYKDVIDNVYLEERAGRFLTFSKGIDEIEKIKGQRGNILDVGCYVGFFLEVAKNRGWQEYGVEPSSWAADYAKNKLRLNVKNHFLRESGFPDRYFDVITLWDTLEHLTDPTEVLNEASRILKYDGLVCASTIDMSSFFAKILGSKWPHLMLMHTFYYTPETIRKLFKKCGLDIIKIERHKRIVRLSYLVRKIIYFSPRLANLLVWLLQKFGIGGLPVVINLGDLMNIYARKSQVQLK